MKLVEIHPPLREGQRVVCCHCHRLTATAKADLDGKAFESYYCPSCEARAAGNKTVDAISATSATGGGRN